MSTANDTVHRGPSKDGKRQVSVFLTEGEYAVLVARAEDNFRSAAQHARALIVAGCASTPQGSHPGDGRQG